MWAATRRANWRESSTSRVRPFNSSASGLALPQPESGRLGITFLRVIFEGRPCRYEAGEAVTSVLLQLDTCLSWRNPVCGVRACLFEDEFAQRCWRGEASARQLVDPPGETGGDRFKRSAAKKLNHERLKGIWTQELASER
jgi:hypothetical protein